MEQVNSNEIHHRFKSTSYTLGEKLGEGGFGQVYRAIQHSTGRDVAIKFILLDSGLSEDKVNRYKHRFIREIQLCSRLQHPNIVHLLDQGQNDGLLFAVFEYVEGKTLKQTLAEKGPLPAITTVQIMSQILAALAHAHEKGIIHRDIKPTNIMLRHSATQIQAILLDFGIGTIAMDARQEQEQQHTLTLTHEIIATPAYSAPEQLRGEPPTTKTDIYTWALVFIECFTATPIYSGSHLAGIYHNQLSPSPVPIPLGLSTHPVFLLLSRALEKNTAERSANAAQLYEQLNQLNFSNLVGNVANYDRRLNQGIHHSQSSSEMSQTRVNTVNYSIGTSTERKQITALCANLQISQTRDSEVDEEIADALFRDQIAQCIHTICGFGSYHVATLAGNLLFYFGYPAASDNDTRLCARAALEVISRINKQNSLLSANQGVEIQIKMGIHCGLVTVSSDSIPNGETANIASQLAQHADNSQILTTSDVFHNTNNYLDFNPHQLVNVGLCKEFTRIFSLLGELPVEAFGFLSSDHGHNAIVGREQELNKLNQLLDPEYPLATCAHIHGEAGLGKSRLSFELKMRANQFSHGVAKCLPEYKNNALYPILNLLKRQYVLKGLDNHQAVTVIEQALKKTNQTAPQDALFVLCSWLGLTPQTEQNSTVFSPNQQKTILFDALAKLLLQTNEKKPAKLFLIEDLHWADPTTIEFIGELITCDQFSFSDSVLVSTSRSELPKMLSGCQFITLGLRKLNTQETTKLAQQLFNNQTIAPKLLETLVTRADGIPLFLEELVDMLTRRHLVDKVNGVLDLINPNDINQIPGSLLDSLQQKLDSLLNAKETAQLAAVIGREFTYNILAAASMRTEEQLQLDLKDLIDVGLIFKQRKVSGDSYIFKHVLVKDTAYQSMTNDSRVAAHLMVAHALSHSLFDGLNSVSAQKDSDTQLEMAKHYTCAKNFEKAISHLNMRTLNWKQLLKPED